jgi:hypothetical protein
MALLETYGVVAKLVAAPVKKSFSTFAPCEPQKMVI